MLEAENKKPAEAGFLLTPFWPWRGSGMGLCLVDFRKLL